MAPPALLITLFTLLFKTFLTQVHVRLRITPAGDKLLKTMRPDRWQEDPLTFVKPEEGGTGHVGGEGVQGRITCPTSPSHRLPCEPLNQGEPTPDATGALRGDFV